MKTLTETYKAIKNKKLRIEAHELQMLNVPSWRVDEKEKQENIQACKKAIEEAKSELIQLYKNLIIDCESELELLQPDYMKSLTYRMLTSAINGVKKCLTVLPDNEAWKHELSLLNNQLAAYEAKHNINPENK